MQPTNAAFSSKEEESKWIQDEAVDPAGLIRPQDNLAAFWIRSKSAKEEPRKEGIEVVLYLVGGGYITGKGIAILTLSNSHADNTFLL